MGIDIGPGGRVNKEEDSRSDADDFTVLGMENRQIFQDSASHQGTFEWYAGGTPGKRPRKGSERVQRDVVKPSRQLQNQELNRQKNTNQESDYVVGIVVVGGRTDSKMKMVSINDTYDATDQINQGPLMTLREESQIVDLRPDGP